VIFEENCHGKIVFLWLCLMNFSCVMEMLDEREIVICENKCIEKKESVFLSLSGGKHFPFIKWCFFVDWN